MQSRSVANEGFVQHAAKRVRRPDRFRTRAVLHSFVNNMNF